MRKLSEDEKEEIIDKIDILFKELARKWQHVISSKWKQVLSQGRDNALDPVRPGKIYGLAKIHKVKVPFDISKLPMRCITSCRGAPLYNWRPSEARESLFLA